MKLFSKSEDKNIDESELIKIYLKYRDEFFRFARKYSGFPDGTIEDIYQDIFVSLFDKRETILLTSSIKTYLFAIGKNLILKLYRKENMQSEVLKVIGEIQNNEFNNENSERATEIVYETVMDMPEPCNKILMNFYWDDKSMKKISKETDKLSENAVKTQKYRCMEKLKSFVTRKLKEENLI